MRPSVNFTARLPAFSVRHYDKLMNTTESGDGWDHCPYSDRGPSPPAESESASKSNSNMEGTSGPSKGLDLAIQANPWVQNVLSSCDTHDKPPVDIPGINTSPFQKSSNVISKFLVTERKTNQRATAPVMNPIVFSDQHLPKSSRLTIPSNSVAQSTTINDSRIGRPIFSRLRPRDHIGDTFLGVENKYSLPKRYLDSISAGSAKLLRNSEVGRHDSWEDGNENCFNGVTEEAMCEWSYLVASLETT
ncbi:hypothetical protein SUNI508_12691 [Seiridium unicorne]|uniref:Uncharacterized protein n=1 Tax=Seiridium unicorne TaxID=138068 RepID=A0ABR2VHM6_9PEZI